MKKIFEVLKTYRPPIFTMLLGAAILAPVWRWEHKLAFPIGLVGMLLIVAGLFWIANILEKATKEKMEAENPYFYDDPIYEKWWEKALQYGSVIFMLIGFMLTAYFSRFSNNLIEEGLYALILIPVCGLLAYFIIYLLIKKFPVLKPNTETRSKELMVLWIGIGLLIGAGFMAYTFLNEPVSRLNQMVKITKIAKSKGSEYADYIFIKYKGEEVKLNPLQPIFGSLREGDSLMLIINLSPFFEFEYASDFSKKPF